MMNESQSYQMRVEQLTPHASEEAAQLLRDLVAEVERLKQENERLRHIVLKSTRKTSMSSKLKDALYE